MGSPHEANKRRIAVIEYRPQWVELFAREREALQGAIGRLDCVLDIQHVGSTSVPGLASKPVVDIAVAVTSFEEAIACVEPVSALGYRYRGEYGIPQRHYFVKDDPTAMDSAFLRTHHLHMLEAASEQWQRHLRFRDALRGNRELVQQYADLKRELAERFVDDTSGYTEAKSEFINRVVDEQRGRRHFPMTDEEPLTPTPLP